MTKKEKHLMQELKNLRSEVVKISEKISDLLCDITMPEEDLLRQEDDMAEE